MRLKRIVFLAICLIIGCFVVTLFVDSLWKEIRWIRSFHSSLDPLNSSTHYASHFILQNQQVHSDDDTKDTTTTIPDGYTCNLYIAPTSLPFDGMGIYAGRTFEKYTIMSDWDSSVIPIIDIHSQNLYKEGWVPLFLTYIWGQRGGSASDSSFEGYHVVDMEMNLGMFPNHHSLLRSLDYTYPADPYDDTLSLRQLQENKTYDTTGIGTKDYNFGAFSYHSGRVFSSTRKIEAAEEIFINYGEPFLDGRKALDLVPRKKDYFDAGKVMASVFQTYNLTYLSPESIDSIDDTVLVNVIERMIELIMRTHSVSSINRTISLLPKTAIEAKTILKAAATIVSDESEYRFALASAKEVSVKKRNMDWIISNGYCLDSIVRRISTIPGIGYGAFARRRISERSIIVHTPMLHIMNKNALKMNHVEVKDDGEFIHHHNVHKGFQLLINYCFGHRKSHFLLCPTTSGMLINHCRPGDTICGSPNARIQWSDDSVTKRWLQMSLDDIEKLDGRGLSLNFIATRDIEPGEEIFIDYGQGWEVAWEKHVASWNVGKDESQIKHNVSATILNRFVEPIPVDDFDSSPIIPNTLFTGCVYNGDEPGRKEIKDEGTEWTNLEDQEILAKYSADGSHYRKSNNFTLYWPCSVLQRYDNNGTDSYTVRIFQPSRRAVKRWWNDTFPRFLTSYPRESIRYFHKPYTSDVHMKGVFRHFIEIPDDMFPQAWHSAVSDQDDTSGLSYDLRTEFGISNSPVCKYNPGDHVEILLHPESDIWKNATILEMCREGQYTISDGSGHRYSNVSGSALRWSKTRRLGCAIRHPFYFK